MVCVIAACTTLDNSPPEGLDRVSLRSGDILFRRGGSLESRVVLSADDGLYSHVAVAVSVGGEMMAAHAVPAESSSEREILKIEPLDIFFCRDRALTGAVGRFRLSDNEQRVIDSMAQYIVAQEIPFDHEYNLDDMSEIYCTELIWILYGSIDQDVTLGKRSKVDFGFFSRELILPSVIYNNPDIQIVWKFRRDDK